jgi:hypothetical protein
MARPALLVLVVLLAACPGERGKGTTPERPVPPEEREGNDREAVKLIRALLKACSYRNGRLDTSCSAYRELRRKLELRRADAAGRTKLGKTLRNLLESDEEVVRLVAAESLFPHLREPEVVPALGAAQGRERVPGVRAAILRQLCWSPEKHDALVRPLLARELPEPVRAEAAACFARGQVAAAETIVALRGSVKADPSAAVRGNACAALGSQRAEAAIPELAAAASQTGIAHRCSAALAAIGSSAAYAALVKVVADTLGRGRIPAQQIVALASFSAQPFFEKERVRPLLARVAADSKQSRIARTRAVAELARIDGQAELRSLRESVGREQGEDASAVREAIERSSR